MVLPTIYGKHSKAELDGEKYLSCLLVIVGMSMPFLCFLIPSTHIHQSTLCHNDIQSMK